MKKNPEKTDASKLAPIFSGFFFCVLRTLAELTLRGLPLGGLVPGKGRRFCCGKNEREAARPAGRDGERENEERRCGGYTSSPPSAERTQFGIVMK